MPKVRCHWCVVILLGLLWSNASFAARPNVIFIMSDDHAYQAIGAYGSALNTTPHIDRLAAEGVRFDRCYVTDSICGPSRATMLTGRYGAHHGVRDNYTEFDGSQTTFPKLLQRAGYQTAMIGKWHLGSEPTGFDHWDILPGQGKYYRPDFLSPAGKREEPGYVTDVITRLTLEWLRAGRDAERPFALLMHHKAPHRPWNPGVDHLGETAARTFPEPATLRDDYATRSAAARDAEMRITQMRLSPDLKTWAPDDGHRQWLYKHMTAEERAAWEQRIDPRLAEYQQLNPQGDAKLRWMYQHYLRDYLECIAGVDDSVGAVLDYLDESGLADNTIVVYTSDQGFYLGEHGWFDKRMMYEQSLRTPLVVRWPGVARAGAVETRIASNVDFAETFLDAAGVEPPPEMQGRSLRPLLTGEPAPDWRTSFYYHYYEGRQRDHAVYKHEGVTTGRHKLIRFYPINAWELYDLQADPQEVANKYGDPAYAEVQAELTAELQRLRTELRIPAP
ncbi:MAG: sulfatase [Planctomycetaceae bacterium]|nr:sulfatase [Planctomycetaceae bacterium]